MTQWHPLFAKLLRPVLQDHYDIQTNVPVGDLPRQADVIVLRRTSSTPPHFHGLWQHLTTWNVLEFKGRTESARVRDLDLLVEVGLGIDRRLNEGRERERQRSPARAEVTFWYLATHLGERFLREARELVGGLEDLGKGLWRGQVLDRPIVLVSNREVAVDRESVPVHLVSSEPAATVRTVAALIVSQPEWWKTYGPWLASLQPELWKEILQMAKKQSTGGLDLTVAVGEMVKEYGLAATLEKTGLDDVLMKALAEMDAKKIAEILEEALPKLAPAKREKVKRLLRE